MITYENSQYSVPSALIGQQVWVRSHGQGREEQVIIVHHGHSGPVEVARHGKATPGSPSLHDEHFPGTPEKVPGRYVPRPKGKAEAAFLAIGEGAKAWLIEAAAAGTARMNQKMDAAVTLAKMAGTAEVDQALGQAAINQRFAHGDLASILAAGATAEPTRAADETASLTQGTAAWAGLGTTNGSATAGEPATDGSNA